MTTSLDADAPYWAAMKEGRLALPRCGGCGHWQWPAVSRCGECGSWNSEWTAVEPRGRVFSWCRTHHPFAGTEGLERPYVSVLVELDGAGGTRLMGLYARSEAPVMGQEVTGTIGATPYADRQIASFTWHPVTAGVL